jgi:hypothetical protein
MTIASFHTPQPWLLATNTNSEKLGIVDEDKTATDFKASGAGLALVEANFVEVENTPLSQGTPKLNNEQWQALIALHWALLREHHDFFLASHHPTLRRRMCEFKDLDGRVSTSLSCHWDARAWNKALVPEQQDHHLAIHEHGWRVEAAYEAVSLGLRSVLNRLISGLHNSSQRSTNYHALCFIPFLVSAASASVMTNSVDRTLEVGQPVAPSHQGDDSGLAWLWHPAIITGLLAGEFAAVHILGEPLLFHGVSMGVSAGAFLLMAFNQEVPFHLQFR